MRPLRILPRADKDVDEAADYYADEGGLDLVLRFLYAIEETLLFLRENPHVGARTDFGKQKLEGLRRWRVTDFESYLVFHRLADGTLEIVRVLHGARRSVGSSKWPVLK